MKHFRKVSAVLLAVLMVAVMLPSFGLFEMPAADAADPGAIVNGGFESGYTTTPHSSGSDSYNKAKEGWTQNEWATNIQTGQKQAGSYAAKITGHNSVAGATALEQVIPVNSNATYTLTFYVKGRSYTADCKTVYSVGFNYSVDVGPTGSNFTTSLANNVAPSITGTGWTKVTFTVQVGANNRYMRLRFIAVGDDNGDSYLDTISLAVVNAGDTGTHAAPNLTGWSTEKNRPSSSSDNVIVQPGFESTTNAQWSTTDFLKQGVSVVSTGGSDGAAHSGSKFLKYYHGSVAYTDWPMFEITLPSAGEYVFSAWVRTPLLSANNVGAASIGIIDRDTNKFLTYGNPGGSYDGHFSNPTTQLRSTATDDNWHLRSVTFYVGAANANIKIGMYGLKSTMYVDDISVHLLTKGTKYVGNQTGTLSASTSVTNKFCNPEDSLIPDSAMNAAVSVDFWSKSSGWNNGMLNFQADPSVGARGTTLHFKGTNTGSNKLYNYIKFIPVEPNTAYTVSFDYRVAAAGNQLMFIDNNIESPKVFHTPSLGSASNSYKTYAFTFNSGNYNRIGIVLRNHASAELYLDDIRFFKNTAGIATEPDEELFPTLKHDHTGKSRMEMDGGLLGLAFRFDLDSTDVTIDNQHIGNYTNGKVQPFEDGNNFKLIAAGAVMTNKAEVGQDLTLFKRENKNSEKTVIDVNAKYLYNTYHKEYLGITHTGITYAVRITNIPESHKGTVIYARPYYIFEYNGKQVTAYGDVQYDSYEKMTDVNDGWLEWD